MELLAFAAETELELALGKLRECTAGRESGRWSSAAPLQAGPQWVGSPGERRRAVYTLTHSMLA